MSEESRIETKVDVAETSVDSVEMPDTQLQIPIEDVDIKKVKEDIPEGVPDKKKFFYTKKVCKFCTKQIEEKSIDYKNVDMLRRFVMPSGRILPRRISGNCARHQRKIVREIKKARIIALLPFLDR